MSRIKSEAGNYDEKNTSSSSRPLPSEQSKRGISVGSFRISNGQSIIASENKKMLLSKVITQVDQDSTNNYNVTKGGGLGNNVNTQRNALHNSLSPQRNLIESLSKLIPPKTGKKKTLVLDLDETLVHSSFTPFQQPSDLVIKIEIDGQIYDINVLIRPGVNEFLHKMAEKYELIIFTASLSKYANPLMNILDKEGLCVYRLFREHCTQIKSSYVKDLKRLNREMKDIVILDNSPMSYALNHDNGFPILSWFDNKEDRELLKITPILEFLSYVPDVRDFIPKMIVNNELSIQRTMVTMNNYNSSLKNSCTQFASSDNTNLTSSYSNYPNATMPNFNYYQGKDGNNDNKAYITSSSKNKKIFLSKSNKQNVSLTKEKPEINIKIINNNITNVIVNNNNDTANTEPNANALFSGAIKKNRSHIANDDDDNNNESVKKISPKDLNTFRTNALRTETNPISLSNLENLKMNKHKKVDSFTFGSGMSKCSFLAGLKSKAMNLQSSTNHHNRQVSLKGSMNNNTNNTNILTETGGSVVIDFKKLKHNDSNNSNTRHSKTKSNQIIYSSQFGESKEMYRPSTSTRTYFKPPIQSQLHQLSTENYINRTASSRLFYEPNSSNHHYPKTNENQQYQGTSYTYTEGKSKSNRPSTSSSNKPQQYKITKKPIRPSQIKDLRIDGNELLLRKYQTNHIQK